MSSPESGALYELGELHTEVGDADEAAKCYERFVVICERAGEEDQRYISACLYLARYYKDRNKLSEAESMASQVCGCPFLCTFARVEDQALGEKACVFRWRSAESRLKLLLLQR